MQTEKQTPPYEQHPLAGGSFINLMKLFLFRGGIDREFIPKALTVAAASFLTIPLRIYESIKFDQRIEQVEIKFPPIFIVGHWRTGTTYLLYLMSRDRNFGYYSTWKAFRNSEIFLANPELAKRRSDETYPKKRGVDGVVLSSDYPTEDEPALANSSFYSFATGRFFARNMKKAFQKYVLFAGGDEVTKQEWKRVYLRFLKRLTLSVEGKRLLLKNPLNTARIKALVEMFPDAKFIHIYRNPYTVYPSVRNLNKKFGEIWGFQRISEAEMDSNIIFLYQEMMKSFFSDRDAIPPENLIEIKYEDFIGNELEYLKKIYSQFNLPGFEQAEPEFKKYIDSQANYETNKYALDEETINKISEEWKFAIEKWQYDIPESIRKKK